LPTSEKPQGIVFCNSLIITPRLRVCCTARLPTSATTRLLKSRVVPPLWMVVNARSCAIRRWVYIQANQSLNWLTTVISPRIYWALKLVPVLWVSTPLPPQRTAHHPLLSGNPIYCWAATKYASIKAFGKLNKAIFGNHLSNVHSATFADA